jgi:hypothetical protein
VTTAAVNTELLVGRRNTDAMIAAEPITRAFRRPVFSETSSGGRRQTGFAQLPEQTFTITPLSGQVWDRSDPTPDEGRLPDVTEQVIGRYNMDIQKDDQIPWEQDGLVGYLLVVHVMRHRGFRTSALIRFLEEEEDGGP